MDRASLIKRRRELIEQIHLWSPASMATNLGPAPNSEYEAYLVTHSRLRQDLANLNTQLGLPEDSQAVVE